MLISARNQLEGKIGEVTLGDIMAHMVVRIGKSQIESVITRRSAEQLGLKKGAKVADESLPQRYRSYGDLREMIGFKCGNRLCNTLESINIDRSWEGLGKKTLVDRISPQRVQELRFTSLQS